MATPLAVGCRDTVRFPTIFGAPSPGRRLNCYGAFKRGRAWKRRRGVEHAAAGHPGAHDGWCSLCKVKA